MLTLFLRSPFSCRMQHLKDEMEILVRELKCNNSIIERSAEQIPLCRWSSCRDDADLVLVCSSAAWVQPTVQQPWSQTCPDLLRCEIKSHPQTLPPSLRHLVEHPPSSEHGSQMITDSFQIKTFNYTLPHSIFFPVDVLPPKTKRTRLTFSS